jgi:hypothetical protein
MHRTLLVVAALGLVALAAGCTMCASPYDYCGPTFTGCGDQPCDPIGRAGSIMAPVAPVSAGEVEAAASSAAEPQPSAEPITESSSDSHASEGTIVYEKKIGETDRAVSEVAPQGQPEQWTARRSSRLTLR